MYCLIGKIVTQIVLTILLCFVLLSFFPTYVVLIVQLLQLLVVLIFFTEWSTTFVKDVGAVCRGLELIVKKTAGLLESGTPVPSVVSFMNPINTFWMFSCGSTDATATVLPQCNTLGKFILPQGCEMRELEVYKVEMKSLPPTLNQPRQKKLTLLSQVRQILSWAPPPSFSLASSQEQVCWDAAAAGGTPEDTTWIKQDSRYNICNRNVDFRFMRCTNIACSLQKLTMPVLKSIFCLLEFEERPLLFLCFSSDVPPPPCLFCNKLFDEHLRMLTVH